MIVVGVDTGGTFTDFIYLGEAGRGVHKTLSTPDNPARAVLEGLTHIADELGLGPDAELFVVHGSTVATNAILERKGVVTALVTNEHFTDVIEIGRQNRSRLYDLAYRRREHIVPRELRFEVEQRSAPDGAGGFTELRAPTQAELAALHERLAAARVESVAIGLLHSYADPAIEERVAAEARERRVDRER